MSLKITTWNINSVRLRIDLVAGFLKSAQPDILCLQETKCPDDAFPLKRFKRLGYEHAAFCGKADCRHISVVLGERARLNDPITLHNFYVPAGGDEPDTAANPKFRHKLDFLDEMRAHAGLRPEKAQRAILVGDLNVAPLEHDVWSHKQMIKVVSHTPVECEKLVAAQQSGGWIDSMRVLTPEPEKLYTWWSYRAMDNWRESDRGRRLDHVWTSDALADRVSAIKIGKNYRGAKRPSDHVPVTATIEL